MVRGDSDGQLGSESCGAPARRDASRFKVAGLSEASESMRETGQAANQDRSELSRASPGNLPGGVAQTLH